MDIRDIIHIKCQARRQPQEMATAVITVTQHRTTKTLSEDFIIILFLTSHLPLNPPLHIISLVMKVCVLTCGICFFLSDL